MRKIIEKKRWNGKANGDEVNRAVYVIFFDMAGRIFLLTDKAISWTSPRPQRAACTCAILWFICRFCIAVRGFGGSIQFFINFQFFRPISKVTGNFRTN